jgi:hypothetical protein
VAVVKPIRMTETAGATDVVKLTEAMNVANVVEFVNVAAVTDVVNAPMATRTTATNMI